MGQGTDRPDSWTAATGQAARWIGLELDLRAPRTWFGPSWAVLAGVVSSGNVPLGLRSLVIVAVAWLISEPLLGSLVALSAEIAKARRDRPSVPAASRRLRLPYVHPDSPGRRALDWLGAALAQAAADWRSLEGAGERWLLLALVAAVLGAVAGGWVPWLVFASLAGLAYVALRRPLHTDGREIVGACQILVAWLVGRSAFANPDYGSFLLGAGYAAIWFAWTRRPPLVRVFAAAHVALAGLLAAGHAPLSAGGILLLAVPPLVLAPEGPSSQRTYLQQTQLYLMAGLLLAAWGLVWSF